MSSRNGRKPPNPQKVSRPPNRIVGKRPPVPRTGRNMGKSSFAAPEMIKPVLAIAAGVVGVIAFVLGSLVWGYVA